MSQNFDLAWKDVIGPDPNLIRKTVSVRQAVAMGNDFHLAKTSSGDTSQVSAPTEGEQARLRSEV